MLILLMVETNLILMSAEEFHMGLEKQNGVISWSLDKEIMPDLLISEFVDNSHTVYENCTFYLSTG